MTSHLTLFSPLRDVVLRDFFGEVASSGEWAPKIDFSENDAHYLIEADLPGLKKEEIKVSFEDDVLTLSGEKARESEEKNVSFHRVERTYGRFSRSIQLDKDVVADGIQASFKDGVLKIEVPKAVKTQAREIAIGAGKEAS